MRAPEDPWALPRGLCWSLWMIGRWSALWSDIRGSSEARSRLVEAWRAAGILLLRGVCHRMRAPPGAALPGGGPALGELSGGKWMARGRVAADGSANAAGRGDLLPQPPNHPDPSGGLPSGVAARRGTIVTWLILPVVICLSQRLSHACLSISNLYGETANGSLNQLSFI